MRRPFPSRGLRDRRARPPPDAVEMAAHVLRGGEPALLMLGDRALRVPALELAARIAAATGCRRIAPTRNARMLRGAGRVAINRHPYPVDQALAVLTGVRHIVLVETREPVAFFAYPGKPSPVRSEDCAVHALCGPGADCLAALDMLATTVGAKASTARIATPKMVEAPHGALMPETLALALAANLPEGGILFHESITSGRNLIPPTASCPPHDWLPHMGGSIGRGTPASTGAAIACPDRKVICLVGDGSALYTISRCGPRRAKTWT